MKAILVIDVDELTYEAVKKHFAGDITLHLGSVVLCKFKDVILQSMPQRKKVGKIKEVDDFMKSDIQIMNEKMTAEIMLDTELLIASGYNKCIDEILGDTE